MAECVGSDRAYFVWQPSRCRSIGRVPRIGIPKGVAPDRANSASQFESQTMAESFTFPRSGAMGDKGDINRLVDLGCKAGCASQKHEAKPKVA